MKLRAFLLTCPARVDGVCAEPRRHFAGTDWPAPVQVFLHEAAVSVRHERITAGMLALLRRALADDADAFLLCEDDLRFNLHLHHILHTWPPLLRGELALGSLYNPGARGTPGRAPGDTTVLIEPDQALGAQARASSPAPAPSISWRTSVPAPGIRLRLTPLPPTGSACHFDGASAGKRAATINEW
ncbi:MAG: hypothetical protein ABI680_19195 [Chthoniobacteraceae bacterium]